RSMVTSKWVAVAWMRTSELPSITELGRAIRLRCLPCALAEEGSYGSQSATREYSRRTAVVSLIRSSVASRMRTCERPPRRSCTTSQEGGSVRSEWRTIALDEGRYCGGVALPSGGTVGRISRDGRASPRYTVLVAGCGVGHTFGQSALAIASRIRCPMGKTQAVVSI